MAQLKQISLRISILLLCISFAFGANISSSAPLMILPQGQIIQEISGLGVIGAVQSSISDLNSGNPAGIVDFSEFVTGISYQFQQNVKNAWLADIGFKRSNSYLPQALGIVHSFRLLHVGLGLNQVYNAMTDYGNVETIVPAANDSGYLDIGDSHPYKNELLTKISLISAYTFNNLPLIMGQLSVGYSYNMNIFKYYFDWDAPIPLQSVVYNETITESNYSLGIRYKYKTQSDFGIKIGISYENNFSLNAVIRDTKVPYYLIGSRPGILKMGVQVQLRNNITISGETSYIHWDQTENNLKNQVKYSASILFPWQETRSYSVGIISTDRNYLLEEDPFQINKKMASTYLFAGVNFNLGNSRISLAIADSHLFSGEWQKSTLIKTGFERSF